MNMAMRDNMIIKFGIALLSLAALFLLIRSNSRPNSRAGLQPQPPYGVVEKLNPDSGVSDKEDLGSPGEGNKLRLHLETKTVTVDADGKSCEISYQEVNGDISDSSRPKLLLLHGAAFNAATWNKQTGTMAKLREWGYRAVAININNECRHNKDVTKGVMLHNIVVALHLSKVVVVSPSMSGTYSVPYVLNAEYRSEIAGYIPVAPVISPAYSAEDFGALNKLKTLIVQGANDHSLGVTSYSKLKALPLGHQVVIADAGHPCYIDQPDVWHRALQKFLSSL